MSLRPGSRLGPYEVISLLGAGGMGEVYLAHDDRLGREVAVKVLPAARAGDADAEARFEREARASASLSHPNICAVFDVGQATVPVGGGTSTTVRYLVMERLEGETLQSRLQRGPLELSALVESAIAMSDALDAAHRQGLLHRDLKPSNIFLTSRGHVKILDFGLAKALADFDASTRTADGPITGDGTVIGTAAYMSPEQLRGETIDARSDVFALGVVLYEMATGRHPFEGTTQALITASILSTPPQPPHAIRADLPEKLADAILKTLEKDRDLRCQSAAELRADLRRLDRSGLAAGAQPVTARARRPLITALTVLVAAGGLLGAYLLWGRSDSAPAQQASAGYEVEALTRSGDASLGVVSADGRFVAYVRRIGADSSLWVRQLPNGTETQRVPPVRGREYVGLTMTPDGNIDFVTRDGTTAPTLSRIAVVGPSEPRGIASDVWSATAWSPDGKHVAFIRARFGQAESSLIVANPDGSNQRVVATRRNSVFLSAVFFPTPTGRPAWSPDGVQLLALAQTEDPVRRASNKPWDVVIVDVATGATLREIPVPNGPREVAWLDASRAILSGGADLQLSVIALNTAQLTPLTAQVSQFRDVTMLPDTGTAVTTQAVPRSGIWMGAADGSGMREIVADSPAQPAGTSMALDGRLVYSARLGNSRSIFLMRPDQPATMIVEDAIDPVITSDGRAVLFRRQVGRDKTGGVWRVNPDGSDVRRLFEGLVIHGPTLVPGSNQFIFTTDVKGERSLWLMSIEGGEPHFVTRQLIGASVSPFVSPDGRKVRFRATDAKNQGFVVECDLPDCGQEWREPITPNHAGPGRAWSPNGRSLAFADRIDLANVWLRPVSGGDPRKITDFSNQQVSRLAWSPDGKHLIVTRSSLLSDIVLIKKIR